MQTLYITLSMDHDPVNASAGVVFLGLYVYPIQVIIFKIMQEITPDTSLKSPTEIVMKQHMREDILEVLKGLHPREREVLVQRYGLDDGRCKSLEEIGRLFHVTKEWIRKIEKAALSKIRREEIQRELKHYFYS